MNTLAGATSLAVSNKPQAAVQDDPSTLGVIAARTYTIQESLDSLITGLENVLTRMHGNEFAATLSPDRKTMPDGTLHTILYNLDRTGNQLLRLSDILVSFNKLA